MNKTQVLTPRQARFVEEYIIDLNGTRAAKAAGYAAGSAPVTASRLLMNAKVSAAITARKSIQLKRSTLTAEAVLEAIRRQVEGDVRNLFDEQGRFRPIHELSAEDAALIAGFDVTQADVTPGVKGPPATVLKVKLKDQSRYVEMGAKHFALLTDVVRLEGEAELVARITLGLKRVEEPVVPAEPRALPPHHQEKP